MAAKIDNAKFDSVPIIEVTKENVAVIGPVIRGAIIGADFIAIDCVRRFFLFREIEFLSFDSTLRLIWLFLFCRSYLG